MPRVEEWFADVRPDVVCMQETKLAEDAFPTAAFEALGYESVHHGQGQWNGVAIVSRVGLADPVRGFADGEPADPEARLVSATCAGIRVSSVYVPNGRELDHDHYRYKLAWMKRLVAHLDANESSDAPVIVTGDFNIAPDDRDVHDPSKFVGATHVSEAERESLRALEKWGMVGLPSRSLQSGPRHAHRSRDGHRVGGGEMPLDLRRSSGPQG
jgi:exodeoxyribonuclease-3